MNNRQRIEAGMRILKNPPEKFSTVLTTTNLATFAEKWLEEQKANRDLLEKAGPTTHNLELHRQNQIACAAVCQFLGAYAEWSILELEKIQECIRKDLKETLPK